MHQLRAKKWRQPKSPRLTLLYLEISSLRPRLTLPWMTAKILMMRRLSPWSSPHWVCLILIAQGTHHMSVLKTAFSITLISPQPGSRVKRQHVFFHCLLKHLRIVLSLKIRSLMSRMNPQRLVYLISLRMRSRLHRLTVRELAFKWNKRWSKFLNLFPINGDLSPNCALSTRYLTTVASLFLDIGKTDLHSLGRNTGIYRISVWGSRESYFGVFQSFHDWTSVIVLW